MVTFEIPNNKSKILFAIFLLLFIYNRITLMSKSISDLPIISTVFSMIIFLLSILFLFYQKDLIKKKSMYKQEKLE